MSNAPVTKDKPLEPRELKIAGQLGILPVRRS
jgi:hypothetical protein